MATKKGFASVAEYIGSFPPEVQKVLKQMRATIKEVVPTAKEKISYQIACFELNGKNLVHYAGWKTRVSMYPIPAGSEAFNKAVSKYAAGKGTIQFPLDQPLPLKLIRQVVKYRVADNLKGEKKKT
ncbi:MAG TPA: DUF1801 domain-containing protein [Anaerolineales bacterium]|nr:DUF1801 domain-containing protein [Anaerolineales bacterium]HMR97896.1 DUF1801 domain-containing protein [Anaerolineales bacterium]HNQ95870.1 DUF1801 domain-containing protein [Anaerolineales bacterium]HNS59468.1 DUF1801 domain-containing protein [Anaerolineales bacterium]